MIQMDVMYAPVAVLDQDDGNGNDDETKLYDENNIFQHFNNLCRFLCV